MDKHDDNDKPNNARTMSVGRGGQEEPWLRMDTVNVFFYKHSFCENISTLTTIVDHCYDG